MSMAEQMKVLSIKGQPPVRITSDRSTFQQGDDSCGAEIMGSKVQLPEDILHCIHALLPMEDAAQAACVSRSFLRSWRCYPKLILSIDSLGIRKDTVNEEQITSDFINRVDHIMQNHSGMGVKMFSLATHSSSNLHPSHVDRWLQVAFTLGVKEFELSMPYRNDMNYNFPCSYLSSEQGSSIQSFELAGCSFHPAAQVPCMRSLTQLELSSVHITGEELHNFLSNSSALENIYLSNCKDIVCLKIPCLLQQLKTLNVFGCQKLEMIDSNAPKLSTLDFIGRPIRMSLGDALQVRKAKIGRIYSSDTLYYAVTKLPSIVPNLQTLVLIARNEAMNTPMAFCKFLRLKYLEISVQAPESCPDYDFHSLVSFLDASPILGTFILRIGMSTIRHDSIIDDFGGDLNSRCLSERCHDNLKNVMITGFCSAKSMIELTIHIIEKAKSLECLTLDTTRGHDKRFVKIDKCWKLSKDGLVEAEKSLVAIRRYVEGRVPPAVNLKVIEPCSKCIS